MVILDRCELPVLDCLPSFGVAHMLTHCFASARRQGEGNIRTKLINDTHVSNMEPD
jgi:hypothetical protein